MGDTSYFINFTNHPSSRWSPEQIKAAEEIGEIIDMPFPEVDPFATEDDVTGLANDCVKKIVGTEPTAVMCQGEFGLTYKVVKILKASGVKCIYACSKRETIESTLPDGSTTKQAVFKFVKFREY